MKGLRVTNDINLRYVRVRNVRIDFISLISDLGGNTGCMSLLISDLHGEQDKRFTFRQCKHILSELAHNVNIYGCQRIYPTDLRTETMTSEYAVMTFGANVCDPSRMNVNHSTGDFVQSFYNHA